jgi:group II intron reverse transcriptase/maturase
MKETSSSEDISTRLQRVAELSRKAPGMVLTTLAHHIDINFLKEAFRRTRKNAAPGIDGRTAEEYSERLDENLQGLLNRFKSGTYKAPPVRRTYIPKGDGSGNMRPLGIPTIEDKVLQRAVTMLLEAVYEQDFYEFSYAYRPGRSQHQAVERLWRTLMSIGDCWVLEVDIRDCFGSLEHKHLRQCLDRRVQDGVLRKAIDKWLAAGIWENGIVERSEEGTPQGGVVSPLLSNIYLHEVCDRWFEIEVRPRLTDRAEILRWADDILMIFANERDARRVLEVLPKRFAKYGLELHPIKTKLTEFKRSDGSGGGGKFDFLGFTHLWAKSKKGGWTVKRRTAKTRFQARLRALADWCRKNRHETIRDQHQMLVLKLKGHFQYYGITGNARCIANFHCQVRRIWFKWLNRRSQRKSLTWADFLELEKRKPLPRPRITHSYLRARPTN